jgi:hypothetical protein
MSTGQGVALKKRVQPLRAPPPFERSISCSHPGSRPRVIVVFACAARLSSSAPNDTTQCVSSQRVASRCTAGWSIWRSSCAPCESQRFQPFHQYTFPSDWVILLAMKGDSDHPLVPIPECCTPLATTPSAAPAAFALVYPDIVWYERVPVATAVWNLNGGILAAAISTRQRNHSRAISRKHAPATIISAFGNSAWRPSVYWAHRNRPDSSGSSLMRSPKIPRNSSRPHSESRIRTVSSRSSIPKKRFGTLGITTVGDTSVCSCAARAQVRPCWAGRYKPRSPWGVLLPTLLGRGKNPRRAV